MDSITAAAYTLYGYDLGETAARRRNNPLTEQMFLLDCLGDIYAADPLTAGE